MLAAPSALHRCLLTSRSRPLPLLQRPGPARTAGGAQSPRMATFALEEPPLLLIDKDDVDRLAVRDRGSSMRDGITHAARWPLDDLPHEWRPARAAARSLRRDRHPAEGRRGRSRRGRQRLSRRGDRSENRNAEIRASSPTRRRERTRRHRRGDARGDAAAATRRATRRRRGASAFRRAAIRDATPREDEATPRRPRCGALCGPCGPPLVCPASRGALSPETAKKRSLEYILKSRNR